MAGNIGMGMAGAAVAGVAMLAWGVSKLCGGSSSDEFGERQNYILHFNGSDLKQCDKAGAGCIIRNKQGELVIAGAYNLDCPCEALKHFHVAVAAAVALKNGLTLAQLEKVKLHLIKGENKEVINRILDRQKRYPETVFLSEAFLIGLIDELKKRLYKQSIDPKTQVKFIGGEANEVARELANYGSNMLVGNQEIYFCEDDLPPRVAQLLEQDKKIWNADQP